MKPDGELLAKLRNNEPFKKYKEDLDGRKFDRREQTGNREERKAGDHEKENADFMREVRNFKRKYQKEVVQVFPLYLFRFIYFKVFISNRR